MSKGGGTKTVETSSDIPTRYRDFVDGNLALAGTIANRPYIPYAGERIAGFSPDQDRAFGMVRGLPMSVQPHLNNAGHAYTAGVNAIANPSLMMDRYRNPHEEQVVDAAVGDLRREYRRLDEGTRLASPFGGSRLALREAENARNFMDRAGSVSGQLRHQGFNTAAQLGQAATDRLLAAGDRSLGLGQAVQGLGLQTAEALAGAGAQQQALDQARLDLRYGDFLDELNYPLSALSIRQSAVGQTPMGTVGRVPVTGGGGLGGTLGGFGNLLSGAAAIAKLCWVAREVYGADNPKWLRLRAWMLTQAPERLRKRYVEIGPRVAERIRHDPGRKAAYRAVMDEILEAA